MSGTNTGPLTSLEINDIRRFCGYPVQSSVYYQDPVLLGWSQTFDQIIALLTADNITIIRSVYLTNLRLLESDLPAVRDNSDTEKAAVWSRNPMELVERMNNFMYLRRALCFFLGIPAGAGVVPLAPAVFTV